MLKKNFDEVKRRIQAACQGCGRNEDEITLVAVSKTKPVETLLEAYNLGARIFGENKVQELVDKASLLPTDIRWHMIGHLQTNKVKYIVGKAKLIHSVDTLRLAEAIDKEALKKGIIADILAEVNVSGEENKFGLSVGEVPAFMERMQRFPHLRVKGLMTVAPYTKKPEENRQYFRRLRQLAVDIGRKKADNVKMDILSMGMTGDYQIAIEEGATMLRVGTALFGERDYA